MKLKCIIVDDEPKSVRLLQGYLSGFDAVEVAGLGYNAQDAVLLIQTHKPHLVFLDISMPGENAFELLSRFEQRDFEVIFTTAYDQYALRAFEEHALHYLLKPIDHRKLEKALERCVQIFENKAAGSNNETTEEAKKEAVKLSIPTHNGYALVDVDKIIRCEGEGNYTKIYTADNKSYLVSQSIKVFEDKMAANGYKFFRVHKKHLINMAFVDAFSRGKGGDLTLSDGSRIPISFRKKSEFVQLIQDHKVTR